MIIISGPTGVGKSTVALALARFLPIEIVNVDVGQFYTPLSLGTAKPDWRAQCVQHHLFDVIDEPINWSVVNFIAHVRTCVQEIYQRGHVPVLVGGTGFYVHALFFPPTGTKIDKRNYGEQDTQQLWQQLCELDPTRARMINQNDRYRITRALDLWHALGQKPSTFKPVFAPVFPRTLFLVLTRERAQLYERINERVMQMLDAGWIDEVRNLSPDWYTFLLEKKLIGYDDIVRYLRTPDISDIKTLAPIIAQKTRAYAKRQLTFNRMITKKVEEHVDSVYTEWVEMAAASTDEAVAQRLYEIIKEKGFDRVGE